MIDTVVPDHKAMAVNLNAAASLLFETHILAPEGVSAISSAANSLFESPGQAWSYTIPKSQPILFNPRIDRSGRSFVPQIGVDKIEVKNEPEKIPFAHWDISLTLEYEDREVHCPRWHFDLCNPNQYGPITHLQYGGYKHLNAAHLDVSVREPRWNVAPMDLILLCEAVAANFFPDLWSENLRGALRWNRLVKSSELLCYPYYLRTLYVSLNASDSPTHLAAMWNKPLV